MSAVEEWNEALEAETERQLEMRSNRGNILTAKQKAVCEVVKADPDLHRRYLEEVNANRRDFRNRG